MSLLNLLDPRKKAWWREDEWYRVKKNQNAYEVVDTGECPSWDLEFWFLEKYKHKHTCEERWRKEKRTRLFDETVFKPPEDHVHYVIIGDDVEIYDGPKYEGE